MSKWFIATLIGASACLCRSVNEQWYGAADFMAPFRHSTSNVVFQRNQTANGGRVDPEVLLVEDDLDLDFSTAGKITLGNRSGIFGVEGSFMGTANWTENA